MSSRIDSRLPALVATPRTDILGFGVAKTTAARLSQPHGALETSRPRYLGPARNCAIFKDLHSQDGSSPLRGVDELGGAVATPASPLR